jgi:hypothetical protein
MRLASFINRKGGPAMGWIFLKGASKADVINSLIAPRDSQTHSSTVLEHCECIEQSENVLWAVVEVVHKNDQQSSRYIACYILLASTTGWGYKDMDESMFPFYFSCPLSYLDMTPVVNQDWRAHVREHHKQRTEVCG